MGGCHQVSDDIVAKVKKLITGAETTDRKMKDEARV